MLDLLISISRSPLESPFVPDYDRLYTTEAEAKKEYDEATIKALEEDRTEEDIQNE